MVSAGTGGPLYLNNDSTGNILIANGGGNVGIGSPASGARLDIKAISAGNTILSLTSSAGATRWSEAITSPNQDVRLFSGNADVFMDAIGTSYAAALHFRTSSSSTTPSEVMTITGGGNVGIGTTAPGERLQVSGNIKIGLDKGQGNGFNEINENALAFGTNYAIDYLIGDNFKQHSKLLGGTWSQNSPGLGAEIRMTGLKSLNGNYGWQDRFGAGEVTFFTNVGGGNGGSVYTSPTYFSDGTNTLAASVRFKPEMRMIIRADGNVGVGVNTPNARLDVAGTVSASAFVQNGAPGGFSPPGTIVMYGGSSAPSGWLLCDGSAVNRVGPYAGLFAAIGTNYGTGDGSTTFTLPDFRGIFPKGAGTGSQTINSISYTAATLGTKGNDKLQAHKHSLATTLGGNPNVDYQVTYDGATSGVQRSYLIAYPSGGVVFVGSATVDGSNGTPRAIGPITEPANVGVTYIIKY
ncbi:MAG: phage tail protein [Candidatus Margulisiibacteriota bacterium]